MLYAVAKKIVAKKIEYKKNCILVIIISCILFCLFMCDSAYIVQFMNLLELFTITFQM